MQRARRQINEAEIRLAYCREMERLRPSADLKKRTLQALARERAERSQPIPASRLVAKPRRAWTYLASAAVLLFAFGAFFALRLFLSQEPLVPGRDGVRGESSRAAIAFGAQGKREAAKKAEREETKEEEEEANAGMREEKALSPSAEDYAEGEVADAAAPLPMEAKLESTKSWEGTEEGEAYSAEEATTRSSEEMRFYPAAEKIVQAMQEAGCRSISGFNLKTVPGEPFSIPANHYLSSFQRALAYVLQDSFPGDSSDSADDIYTIALESARIENNELVFTAVLPGEAPALDLRVPLR